MYRYDGTFYTPKDAIYIETGPTMSLLSIFSSI